MPQTIPIESLPAEEPDPVAGERIFWAGGCSSCHATPVDGKSAKGKDRLLLGGGVELKTAYGVFRVPNISPHMDDGIGRWTTIEFVNAMQRGVSPTGRHYFPVFPYTSFAKMRIEDVIDLKAFLDTLTPVEGRVPDHTLSFAWSFRRGIGAWKRLYLNPAPVTRGESDDPLVDLGRDLVEGPGHCGACHTPRDAFGGLITNRWLAGAPNPVGKGRIPNINPAGENVGDWTVADIAFYLKTGFTPDFIPVSGAMVSVQRNMAQLPEIDRWAIAAYLKSIPASQ